MYRIAVIEDHVPVNDSLREQLQDILPGCEVHQFFEPTSALKAIESAEFDLVVTDVDLGPGTDKYGGVKIARALDTRRVPLLIVSGSPEHEFQHGVFKALDAWDYLQKPISPGDFRLQVERAIQSRIGGSQTSTNQTVEHPFASVPDLSIQGRGPATWKGEKVRLSMSQLDIVEALASHAGQLVTHQELFKSIPTGKNLENLRVKLSAIRRSFEDVDATFDRIRSVPLTGYLWRID